MRYELVRPHPLVAINMDKTRATYRVVDKTRFSVVVACTILTVAILAGIISAQWMWQPGQGYIRTEAAMAEYDNRR